MADFVVVDIPIRYDGRDADKHQIDLFSLGESIQGVARLVSAVGNFVVTGRYSKRFHAQAVRVIAKEAGRPGCFTLDTALQWAQDARIFSGFAGSAITALIAYIVHKASRNRGAEMKYISEALQKAIEEMGHTDRAHTDRLMETIEKMADDLKPSVKRAVTPVGTTCSTMRIGKGEYTEIDEPMKEAIMSEHIDVLATAEYEVLITELDMENGSCKVHIGGAPDDRSRTPAVITDPAASQPNNPYVVAMSNGSWLRVHAKATAKGGELQRLYISDTVS